MQLIRQRNLKKNEKNDSFRVAISKCYNIYRTEIVYVNKETGSVSVVKLSVLPDFNNVTVFASTSA